MYILSRSSRCCCLFSPPTPKAVISTGGGVLAAVVERPPYFVFAFAVCSPQLTMCCNLSSLLSLYRFSLVWQLLPLEHFSIFLVRTLFLS